MVWVKVDWGFNAIHQPQSKDCCWDQVWVDFALQEHTGKTKKALHSPRVRKLTFPQRPRQRGVKLAWTSAWGPESWWKLCKFLVLHGNGQILDNFLLRQKGSVDCFFSSGHPWNVWFMKQRAINSLQTWGHFALFLTPSLLPTPSAELSGPLGPTVCPAAPQRVRTQ